MLIRRPGTIHAIKISLVLCSNPILTGLLTMHAVNSIYLHKKSTNIPFGINLFDWRPGQLPINKDLRAISLSYLRRSVARSQLAYTNKPSFSGCQYPFTQDSPLTKSSYVIYSKAHQYTSYYYVEK